MRRAVKAPTVAETIYALLCAEAKAHPELLTSFATDLHTHDRAALGAHPGRPFAWLLYQHGTHLVWMPDDSKPLRSAFVAEARVPTYLDSFAQTGDRFYLYDGQALKFCPTFGEFAAQWQARIDRDRLVSS